MDEVGDEVGDDVGGARPDPRADIDAARSVPAAFARVVAAHGAQPALATATRCDSYDALNRAANRIAHRILDAGGAVGDRVAVLLRHGALPIACLLGVLKAGRVAVMLNPGDPPLRLEAQRADAEVAAILTDRANRALAAQLAGAACVVMGIDAIAEGEPSHDPAIAIAPADMAVLTYTSGSTGRPKAVIQTHGRILDNDRRLGPSLAAARATASRSSRR
jgi:acyl-CoA synthetase (AMP-forming)/AMP-acid ligase II